MPSWILKMHIFGHLAVIEFQMCSRIPNVIQIGWFFRWVTAILRFAIGRQSTILNFKHSHSRDHVTVTEFNHRVQSPHLCTKFHRNRMIFRSDMSISRFSRWQLSAILNFRGPIMGSLKSPCKTYYRSSIETISVNWLVSEIIALFVRILATDKRTDERTDSTDGQHRCIKALSLSRAAP